MEVGGLSDHCLVFLQLEVKDNKPSSSFKFNPKWLAEDDFQKLIKANWAPYDGNINLSASEQFAASLKLIKEKVVAWSAERHKIKEKVLLEVEDDIKSLFYNNHSGIFVRR